MNFEDLKNPEFQEKLMACQSADELVRLAGESSVELSNEQLEAVSGSFDWSCPEASCTSMCGNLCNQFR